MRALAIFVLAAALTAAADVSGNWAGRTHLSVNGRVEEDTMLLSLKQSGDRITGTAGPTAQQQAPIRNGKIDGNHVTFETPVPNGVFQFAVNLEDGHLKGDLIAQAQGQTIKATVDVTRVK